MAKSKGKNQADSFREKLRRVAAKLKQRVADPKFLQDGPSIYEEAHRKDK